MNILLTGASRGIGAAAFEALTATGHRVAGHSTRGGGGLIAGDLADVETPRLVFGEALERLGGRIDVLVNNAGIYEGVEEDADDDEWDKAWRRTLAVNLESAASLSRLAIGHFRQFGGGRIVNVASRASYRGDSPRHRHYAASKAGLIAVTKTIARAHAAEKIFAFAVAPGFTVSEMTEEYLQGRGGAAIVADIPLGRVTGTSEVAEAIRWLAIDAPEASTGSVIDLNGASHVR